MKIKYSIRRVNEFGYMVVVLTLLILICPSVTPASTWYFDMGLSSSSVQTSYTQVRASTIYNPSSNNYGWDSNPSPSYNTYSGDSSYNYLSNLLYDRHYGSGDKTFSANVDDGWYYVTLYFWWTTSNNIDNEIIYAEDSQIYELDYTGGDVIITEPLKVEVSDGTLNLRFSDADTTGTKKWFISGIDITPVPIPLCEGDFDTDGDVDGSDLSIFISAYAIGDLTADLENNGVVDTDDLAVFATDFGRTDCP